MLNHLDRKVLQSVRKMLVENVLDEQTDQELLRRFVQSQDESAFAVLLRRHGPMVRRACQRILHNWHDAEDAYQAAFLVLARKAGAVRWDASVAGWLHETAIRIAMKARTMAGRRKIHEQHAPGYSTGDALQEITGRVLTLVSATCLNGPIFQVYTI